MYTNANLESHFDNQSVISSEAGVYAEVNMNSAENIKVIGNYRNRPGTDSAYAQFVEEDATTASPYYYGYTDSDVVVDSSSVSDADIPLAFSSIDQKKNLLFSLEDCFGKFRPRSGINKAVFYGGTYGHYLHHTNQFMMNRPRYYMASKDDNFKYWTSFRKEAVTSGTSVIEVERGISNRLKPDTTEWYIDDAAPFVVYNEDIPINRIILKIQTHVGTTNFGSYYNGLNLTSDPFYDEENIATNRTVPISWRVEYLEATDIDENTEVYDWITLKTFTSADTPIPRDGYLELQYSSSGWQVASSSTESSTPFFTEFANPSSSQIQFIRGLRIVVDTMNKKEAAFEVIELSPRLAMDISDITVEYNVNKVASDLGVSGLPVGQLLASTGSMTIADFDQVLNQNNINSVIAKYIKRNVQVKFFEVIKDVDVSGTPTDFYVPIKTMYVESFPEIKNETRIATIALRDLYFYFESLTAPELLISNASLSYAIAMIFDSIGFSNYIYLKSDNDEEPIIPHFFVAPNQTVAQVLQDLAISTQTSMFLDEYNNFVLMSKSYMLADAGDRNAANTASEVSYTFYGTKDYDKDGVYRNERSNAAIALSNISEISSKNNNIFNDGKIIYTSRYIQKSFTETRMASLVDEEKVWQYKPALLWEVSPTERTISRNEQKQSSADYSLSAIPINSKLSSEVPTVSGGIVINNTIDLGEAVFFMSRYNGYFYANGEIIRYDAVEYSVSQPSQTELLETTTDIVAGQNTVSVASTATLQIGQRLSKISGVGNFGVNARVASITNATTFRTDVNHLTSGAIKFVGKSPTTNYWISSVEEYQKYFAEVPFNGKMYPTGRVRIYSEPRYTNDTTLANGAVAAHGRGQFGTEIVEHSNSLPEWVSKNEETNIAGCAMKSELLFGDKVTSAFQVQASVTQPTNTKQVYVIDADRKKLRVGQSISVAGVPAGTKIVKLIPSGFEMDKARTATVRSPTKINLSGIDIYGSSLISTTVGKSGLIEEDSAKPKSSFSLAKKSSRTSIIRNFLSSKYYSELDINSLKTTQSGTVQSAALVMTGPTITSSSDVKPLDFISYVYNNFDSVKYTHMGARIRILGVPENNSSIYQTPSNSADYYSIQAPDSTSPTVIKGASGGIGVLVNRNYNSGYFFEIAALSVNNIGAYSDSQDLFNLVFYKTKKESGKNDKDPAIPLRLWTGKTNILVDDGKFTGQYRITGEERPTVYDIAVEYQELSDTSIKFFLYLNNNLVGTVIDDDAIPKQYRQNTLSLFVRGESKVMFENAYAVKPNESANYVNSSETPLNAAANLNKEYEIDEAYRRYSIPAAVQNTYLSKISPLSARGNDVYFEEFGTIMRECAYFNVKYDRAYPALYAKIAPTFNRLRGYAVSGFIANAYGAEFLVFNTTDTPLNLDSSSGNYLKILGVTFTQESTHDYSVDEYFEKYADLSDPAMRKTTVLNAPLTNKKNYQSIKNSRMTYGKNDFSIQAGYIQSQDSAEELMGWIVSKIMKPRISVGLEIFPNPALQLGDLVTIAYQTGDTLVDEVSSPNSRFVIYNIEYKRSFEGPSMTVYLSQVSSEED
jgi:hypothetical protein